MPCRTTLKMKKLFPLSIKIKTSWRKLKIRYLIAMVVAVVLLENCVLIYDNLQNRTVILGLQFEHRNLTGLRQNQIQQLIEEEQRKRDGPLTFSNGSKTYQLFPSEIGYKVDAAYLANNLLQVGRTGSFFHKFLTQQKALFGMENTMINGTFSQSLLLLQVAQIQQTFEQNPQIETLDFRHNLQKVIPAKDGVKIQVDKLINTIVSNIANPPSRTFILPTYIAFASIHTPEELNPIRQQVEHMVMTPISITSNGKTLTLTQADLQSLLTILERPDPDKPGKTKLVLRLDDQKLSQKIGLFAWPIDEQTHAEFNEEDAKVAILSQFFSGKRIIIDIPTGHNIAQSYVLGTNTKKISLNQGNITSLPSQPVPITPKIAYLTFDDGPNTIYHPMILDILKTYNVKATFFLIGQNAQRDSDVVKRTVAEGHLIGNHSLTHSFMPNLSSNTISSELQTTDAILNPMQNITLFRPPYGGINYYVRADAHTLGLKIFLWDVDPQDWAEPPTDELVRRVISATHDGSNILLHSNHLATVRALPKIIATLQAEGYTFRRLDAYPRSEED